MTYGKAAEMEQQLRKMRVASDTSNKLDSYSLKKKLEKVEADAVVPEKYLTSYFFPGWRTAIGTGKVRGPMCSYNRYV